MTVDQLDVYISYAPEDEAEVRRIVEELERAGLRVWFQDQPSSSQESLANLRQILNPSNCQVVVWSNNSAGSGRIQAEARAGSALGRLVAARIHKDIAPPRDTDAVTYADLVGWNGGTDHRGMKKLLTGIRNLTGKGRQPDLAEIASNPSANPRPAPIPGLAGREENMTPEQKDERAWQTCLAFNNRTYYEHYLAYFPDGKYAREAGNRIARKKRTSIIIAACAILYVIGQFIASVILNIDKF
jgi:TIR domain